VRVDRGFALSEDDRIQGREVSAGYSRLHASVTLARSDGTPFFLRPKPRAFSQNL
jgi:hypothetical protein